MANNYTLWSTALGGFTKEQAEWAKARLLELSEGFELYEPDEQEKITKAGYDTDGATVLDFRWEMREEDGRWSLWMYSEENGSVTNAAVFVQEFFKYFNMEKACFGLTWASTCSSPRIDEFSGGAVFVTMNKIEWYEDSLSWLERNRHLWSQENK